MTFDIRQLRYAIAAADHGSFYRAARSLEVEQSTLSRAILRLERSIGVPIFNRSRAGVVATAAGQQFLNEAQRLVDQSDRMVRLARAGGRGNAGAIVFGHSTGLSASNLRSTLAEWRRSHRDVDMGGIEASRDVLLSGMDSGSIDFVFQVGDEDYTGLDRASLWSERVMVALPAGHPLAERSVIQWSDLRGELFVLSRHDPGPDICNMILQRLSDSR